MSEETKSAEFQKTENKDEAAVVGNALRLYDAFTTLIMSGAKIFIHRPDGSMVEAKIF